MQPDLTPPLTRPALEAAERKLKKEVMFYQFAIGLLAGVAGYAAVRGGLHWPAFFPLLLMVPVVRAGNKHTRALRQVRAQLKALSSEADAPQPPPTTG